MLHKGKRCSYPERRCLGSAKLKTTQRSLHLLPVKFVLHGVVSGWSDQAQPVVNLPAEDSGHEVHGGARGQPSSLRRLRTKVHTKHKKIR